MFCAHYAFFSQNCAFRLLGGDCNCVLNYGFWPVLIKSVHTADAPYSIDQEQF